MKNVCMIKVAECNLKETEKAFGLKLAQGCSAKVMGMAWFPKSMCQVAKEGNEVYLLLPEWIVLKNTGNSYLAEAEAYFNDTFDCTIFANN